MALLDIYLKETKIRIQKDIYISVFCIIFRFLKYFWIFFQNNFLKSGNLNLNMKAKEKKKERECTIKIKYLEIDCIIAIIMAIKK